MRKRDYLLWIGRMNPVKGPQRAIEAARMAGLALVLAGPVQSGFADFFAAPRRGWPLAEGPRRLAALRPRRVLR